ncbi:LysR substrate-binding domain-containing protein [Cryobacterium sp. Hh38]|uniref:LysR substrate-binding domain-containing protein n=1 Tax=Cryobacterium sp. Hh38 TaxID=1259156 RepID=UPI001F54579E|nr:LysR substrate-binding domain-containing protein [Cryobacterium sp. Hh38]
MLSEAEELSAAVGQGVSAITGPVRLGAIDTLAPVLLPKLISATSERHPSVHIDFKTGDQASLLNLLVQGDLDLLITFDIDVPPELNRRSLYQTEACIVVSSDHPLAQNETATLDDVADEPMVLLDISSSRVHTLELMSTRAITPKIAFRTDNYELCRSLVGRGLGYSLLMRRAIDAQTWDGGQVVYLPIRPRPRSVNALVAWSPGRVPPRVSALIDICAEVGIGLRAAGLSPDFH